MLYAGLYRKMNAITAREAAWLFVSAYRALAIVQPVNMSVSDTVQTMYAVRRRIFGTVSASVVPLMKPQHVIARLMRFFVRSSCTPTLSRMRARK